MFSRNTLFASLAIASLSLFGCDPAMPGAAGQVSLGSGVDASKFQNIEMRAVVAEGEFDPQSPVFPVAISENLYQSGEGESVAWVGDIESQERGVIMLQRGEALKTITFPHSYQLGGEGIGYTEEQHWRLFMWLSPNPDSHLDKAPASGDPYGVVDFDAHDCGSAGYCNVQDGIDLTLDQTAP